MDMALWGDLILFIAIGFAAQLVDGAIGMAYGLSATTILLNFGITPPIASASVHAAEVFTTGLSGAAHWRLGNVRWDMVWRLAVPGMAGGAAGAYVLTATPLGIIQPAIALYLLFMGGWILWKAFHRRPARSEAPKWIPALGLGGGFVDAIGGGGWGPVVNGTLIGSGTTPRYTIGSVNMAEFFVTVAVSITFLGTIGFEFGIIILGLIVGGALASPLGAYVARRLPDRPMMILVGVMIMLLSLRTLVKFVS